MPGAAQRAALFVHAGARQGEQGFAQARQELESRGVELAYALCCEDIGALQRGIERALAEGIARFVVGGGDGTLSLAANLLAQREATLAVLPMGTANDFARALHIPDELSAACATAVEGHPTSIDVGSVNSKRFLNATSFGFSSTLAENMSDEQKQRFGALAYPLAAVRSAGELQPFQLSLTYDGQTLQCQALQVVVGNGRYHGGGCITAPEASVFSGQLDAYVVQAPEPSSSVIGEQLGNLAALTKVALKLKRGEHLEDAQVFHVNARQLKVQCTPSQTLNVDGELWGETPATFDILPKALRIVMPKP